MIRLPISPLTGIRRSSFKDVYIQSAAGDGGGAIGAAYWVWNEVPGNTRCFTMYHAYWGAEFSNAEISSELRVLSPELERQQCTVEKIEDEEVLCRRTAERVAEGKVIGWFQGRMEWGPRALGNRSIIGDPRRADMKDILNLKIKRRESFRPFAPSIIREAVTESQNQRYYQLIKAFENITKIPLVLNTSFNENEPVVCTPLEALACFLRTKMDVLVMGNYFLSREGNGSTHAKLRRLLSM